MDLKKLKIFLFALAISSLFGIERKEHTPVKLSVIIPCHPEHFPLLDPLFQTFADGTSLPDEIVVSLSLADRIPAAEIAALPEKGWPFPVVIVTTPKHQAPGKNRNSACAASIGDVIVCQDADDLPHPQRIEAVRYLFENFQIDHLLHQWLPSDGTFRPFAIQGLENECRYYRSYMQIDLDFIHNGSVCFSRAILDKVKWNPILTIDEDSIFNRHASSFFPNHFVLPQPLIRYRGELSTFDLNGNKEAKKAARAKN